MHGKVRPMTKILSAAVLVIVLAVAVPMGAIAKEHKRDGGSNSDGAGDLIKAVAGLTAIAIIANEVKKGKKAKEAAEAQAAAAAKARQAPRVCNDPYWDGVSWRNRDGRVCLPTPAVCLRETIHSNRSVKRFDYECMWNEGFRLSSVDR